ncbi:hypothetical protein CGC21_19845 [Leishmania donovani]|uniref:Uncharacterized protein n=1 Tax=Leishmania donovani TaxID=5661 RepID=A0A504XBI4_LEIDO|nr:hypothetical protein CGC21_19845 [Leishmania donovani]
MAQPCSSGTSRPAAALGHASSVHLSSFLGYVLRDRRQADPAGLHALIQAGHLRGRGIPQCGAATLHIGVCGGSTVQPGVAPSCFRHLRHISPPGPMQEMPHLATVDLLQKRAQPKQSSETSMAERGRLGSALNLSAMIALRASESNAQVESAGIAPVLAPGWHCSTL